MNILILAAGYGTRLYPLTLDIPKPLILINRKPIINFLIEKISIIKKYFRVKKIIVVCNNKFYNNFLLWKKKCLKKYLIEISILNDGSNSYKNRLGAVRDIGLGIGNIKSDWLILGGDNIFEDSLIDFLKFAKNKRPYPTIGIFDIKDKEKASRFGVVKINLQKKIIEFVEKPKNPKSTLIGCCIYYFPVASLKFLYLFLKKHSDADASGKYISWLVDRYKVFGYTLKGKWLDIGCYDSLKEAEKNF